MILTARGLIASTVTLIRLPVIALFIISFSGPLMVSLAWIIVWLLLDQFDGVIARWLGVDNVARRVMDVVVDHISVTCSFMAAFYYHNEYLTPFVLSAWAVMACFKLGYSLPGIASYVKHGILLRSIGSSNKVFNLGQAVTGIMMIYGISAPMLAIIICVLCALKVRPTLISISAFRKQVCHAPVDSWGTIIENNVPLFGAVSCRIVHA